MQEYPPQQPYPPPDYYQPPTGPMPPQPPPQYSQPFYPPQPYYPYPPPRPMNKHAEQALMFGILSLFLGLLCGIPAIILALMALSEISSSGEDGSSRANIGLLLGFLSILVSIGTYYLLTSASFAP